MKKRLVALVTGMLCMLGLASQAQDFRGEIMAYREGYKEKFAHSAKAPIQESDFKYLSFYEPDSSFRVTAKFTPTPNSEPFDIPTYSGMKKEFVKYGEFSFKLKGQSHTLNVYRNLTLAGIPTYKDHLFIPFKDLTNAQETYGGGRYLDLYTTEINNSLFVLDFNKVYNPYCAYSEGFNCPIPPKENHLNVRVEAGERNYAKEH